MRKTTRELAQVYFNSGFNPAQTFDALSKDGVKTSLATIKNYFHTRNIKANIVDASTKGATTSPRKARVGRPLGARSARSANAEVIGAGIERGDSFTAASGIMLTREQTQVLVNRGLASLLK